MSDRKSEVRNHKSETSSFVFDWDFVLRNSDFEIRDALSNVGAKLKLFLVLPMFELFRLGGEEVDDLALSAELVLQ
ncbi:hypothetical protein SAMN05421753_108145 [Planctomicrobium piriforme]|uniref:Uncharacterized protein n=1 Tax=Planctomicrobium piriforme TaxID=1576369 RepID=A0A1I3HQ24_9PLAN|nr:hypothetical protein SAMN05421753_108145 [Planctomicrobium piriforme]